MRARLFIGIFATVLAASMPARAQSNGCIDLARMRSTHALDDSTILVTLRNKDFAKITLQSRCVGLKIQDGFSYATSITKLCPGDIITVLGGGGDRCGIASITPMSAAEAKALQAAKK